MEETLGVEHLMASPPLGVGSVTIAVLVLVIIYTISGESWVPFVLLFFFLISFRRQLEETSVRLLPD
jgi:hypothetical protein